MFVSEEEHECHWVVEFVHLLEVRHLIEIAHVENCKVFDSVGDSFLGEEKGPGGLVLRSYAYCDAKRVGGMDPLEGWGAVLRNGGKRTVENFILTHAVWIPVTAEAYDNEAVLF